MKEALSERYDRVMWMDKKERVVYIEETKIDVTNMTNVHGVLVGAEIEIEREQGQKRKREIDKEG